MKKLTILLIFISSAIYAQVDTTVFFDVETKEKVFAKVLFESEFKTIDTILFDESQDSTSWKTSRWIRKDSTYVNPNTYRIREFQRRMNDQGILQRRARLIRYSTRTIKIRTIR